MGAHVRALRWDVAGSVLKENDRLEPSATLRDVGKFDIICTTDLPLLVTFWRGVQQRVKFRNPLFDEALGVVPDRCGVDALHALNLGVMKRFATELVWQMMWNSIWVDRRGKVQDVWLEDSVVCLRSELTLWEDADRRSRPLHKQTKIKKLEGKHFGTPTKRELSLKAAETKAFFYFSHYKLQSIVGRL